MTVGRRRLLLLRALAIATAVVAAGAGAEEPRFRLREPGDRLPALTLPDLEGTSRQIGSGDQGPTLLFFWSVFCPNCKEALPALAELHGQWAGRGLSVWAINVDGDRFSNAVLAYTRVEHFPFPVVYDRLEGDTLVAADPLGVTKTPTVYLASREGTILFRQAIELDFAALVRALEDAAGR